MTYREMEARIADLELASARLEDDCHRDDRVIDALRAQVAGLQARVEELTTTGVLAREGRDAWWETVAAYEAARATALQGERDRWRKQFDDMRAMGLEVALAEARADLAVMTRRSADRGAQVVEVARQRDEARAALDAAEKERDAARECEREAIRTMMENGKELLRLRDALADTPENVEAVAALLAVPALRPQEHHRKTARAALAAISARAAVPASEEAECGKCRLLGALAPCDEHTWRRP